MKVDTTTPFSKLLGCLCETGGLKETDSANFAEVSVKTVSRWSTACKAPYPEMQLLVSDLAWIVTRLGEFCRPDEIRIWLYARHPQLDGERTVDPIRARRTENVLAVLDRLDTGAYL